MSAPETSPRRTSQGLRARLSFAVIVLFAFTAAWGEFTAITGCPMKVACAPKAMTKAMPTL